MKSLIKTIALLLIININSYSQVLPISKEIKDGSTKYYTNLAKTYQGLVASQNVETISRKIKREVSKSNIDFNVYNSCFITSKINEIVDKKGVIIISYFTNETGNIYAASLTNYKNKIVLTDNEAKCILTKAMEQKINFTFKNGIFPFYLELSHAYRPNLVFENPHEEEDPDLDDGQY